MITSDESLDTYPKFRIVLADGCRPYVDLPSLEEAKRTIQEDVELSPNPDENVGLRIEKVTVAWEIAPVRNP